MKARGARNRPRTAPNPQVLFVLDERERAKLQPYVAELLALQQRAELVSGTMLELIRMKAGRDDVSINLDTYEVTVASGKPGKETP